MLPLSTADRRQSLTLHLCTLHHLPWSATHTPQASPPKAAGVPIRPPNQLQPTTGSPTIPCSQHSSTACTPQASGTLQKPQVAIRQTHKAQAGPASTAVITIAVTITAVTMLAMAAAATLGMMHQTLHQETTWACLHLTQTCGQQPLQVSNT